MFFQTCSSPVSYTHLGGANRRLRGAEHRFQPCRPLKSPVIRPARSGTAFLHSRFRPPSAVTESPCPPLSALRACPPFPDAAHAQHVPSEAARGRQGFLYLRACFRIRRQTRRQPRHALCPSKPRRAKNLQKPAAIRTHPFRLQPAFCSDRRCPYAQPTSVITARNTAPNAERMPITGMTNFSHFW